MKIDDNGIIRDMTADEIAAFDAMCAETQDLPQENTRLDEIEAALMELAALVGGEADG